MTSTGRRRKGHFIGASLLSPLDRKLVRDLWRVKGQALAIILVLASGIALLVMSQGMMMSLDETMRTYYERTRFADAYAPVTRAPRRLLDELRALPGVDAVEGRVSGAGLIDLPDNPAPVSARVLSIDPSTEPRVNALYLTSGRLIDPAHTDEILLLKPFAEAHGLEPGDTLAVTMYGARHEFDIVGLALSAEFVYAIAPGEFVADPARFAVIWAGEEAMAAAFDLDGAFNEAIFTFSRDAEPPAILAALDRILAPYGAVGAYLREDQTSNRYLVEELKQLDTMSRVMTPVFMMVSIFLLNVVITRLVQTEREQIGLMKAFGYSNREIGLHYLKFAAFISLIGAALGWGVGLWFGRVISGVYQIYFHFPFLVYVPAIRSLGLALGVSFAAAAAGAFVSVRGAVVLQAAEAMRPPAPMKFKKSRGLMRRFEEMLDQPSRMIYRNLVRKPGRAALAAGGIGVGMGLSVMMQFNTGATDYMLDVSFNVADRSDVLVTFSEPLSEKSLFELRRIDGVLYAEPYRSTPVLLRVGREEHLGAITGLPPTPVLNRAVDSSLNELSVTGAGVLLSEHLAKMLGVSVGDVITAEVREGRRPELDVRVSGLIDALIGTPAYMPMDRLNRLLKEPGRTSGAYMKIDLNKADAIYEELKNIPNIAGVSLRREAYAKFEEMIDEGLGVFRQIMTMFSIIIAAGVVYNTARISYIEHQRDLASLRVLGFTRAEAGYVLLGELAVVTLMAIPIGCLVGYLIWAYLADAMSTELYQVPTVYREDGFGVAAIIVIIAAIAAGAFVQRDVMKLEIATALKTRE